MLKRIRYYFKRREIFDELYLLHKQEDELEHLTKSTNICLDLLLVCHDISVQYRKLAKISYGSYVEFYTEMSKVYAIRANNSKCEALAEKPSRSK